MAEFRVHRVNFFEYNGHAIHNIAYDEVEDQLALSRKNGSIEIWSIRNDWFQEKILPPTEDESVEALQWCKGRLFSAGLHGNLLHHDLRTLTTKSRTSANCGQIWCLAANKEETVIVAGTESGCVALFDVSTDFIQCTRLLDKVTERIMSIAWHSGPQGESLIVTGGMDNIRVWSEKSGHPIERITLPSLGPNTETIVWSLAVTQDLVIISGDSRGKTSFWDGRTGTLIKAFGTQHADILDVAVNKSGTKVYSVGVNPVMTVYERLPSAKGSHALDTWVRSHVRTQHTHDVRAVALTSSAVVTGGVDCTLAFNSLDMEEQHRKSRKISAIPEVGRLVAVAKQAKIIALRYPDTLELWKLGSTLEDSERSGDELQLTSKPVKLLQLKSRGSEYIVCHAISPKADWLVYSDQDGVRFFRVTVEEAEFEVPRVSVQKVKSMSALSPSHALQFTPDGGTLVSATCEGGVQLITMTEGNPSLHHEFTVTPELAFGIHLLSISSDSKYFAIGDHKNNVRIYKIEKKCHYKSLPCYEFQPTAMCFHPTLPLLLVAYTDQKIMEYDLKEDEYTEWSRKLNRNWNQQWLRRYTKITHIMYNASRPHQIILADKQLLCVVDKNQNLPGKKQKIFEKSSLSKATQKPAVQHAFHPCNRFKYNLHVELLDADFLLLVERSPSSMTDQLPEVMDIKKFGI